jgi:hypothetical protein
VNFHHLYFNHLLSLPTRSNLPCPTAPTGLSLVAIQYSNFPVAISAACSKIVKLEICVSQAFLRILRRSPVVFYAYWALLQVRTPLAAVALRSTSWPNISALRQYQNLLFASLRFSDTNNRLCGFCFEMSHRLLLLLLLIHTSQLNDRSRSGPV